MAEVELTYYDLYPSRGTVSFEIAPDIGGVAKVLEFNHEGYSEFLREVGFGGYAVDNTTVSFQSCSPRLQAALDKGGEIETIQTGRYSHKWDDSPCITLFAADIALESAATGLMPVEVMGEALNHESGHMYQDVVLGQGVASRRQRFHGYMTRLGLLGKNFGRSMVRPETLQALHPAYLAYPVITGSVAAGSLLGGVGLVRTADRLERERYAACDKEKFADDFARKHRSRLFIHYVPDLTGIRLPDTIK